jgi:putative ABC transport system substrate-binding protein
MSGKILISLLATVLLTTAPPAEAQQAKKIPRIGYLTVSSLSANAARIEAFRQGLRELGYVEGKISSLSGDLQRANSNARVNSPPN